MSRAPTVVVVGAGAVGGWTALELTRRGAAVTLLDAWGPGNLRACSSGEQRIIRATYGPDAFYVPLVARAFELWRELEVSTGTTVYHETGLLWLFSGGDAYAAEAARHLESYGFSLDELPAAKAHSRFPRLRCDDVESIYFEPRAGLLAARAATRILRDEFVRAGGNFRRARALPPPEDAGSLAALGLADVPQLHADAFVFACGPWLRELFPETMGHLIRPSRQEEYYLGPPAEAGFTPPELPPWLDFADRMSYAVPSVGGRGLKVADDTRGEPFDPTDGERKPTYESLRHLRRLLARRLPDLAEAPVLEARVCQYENSPDGHPMVDRHPQLDNTWIAGGGSGHLFKLAPALGERVAQMILEDARTESEFSIGRFDDQTPDGPSSQYET
ncbi:MAG: FAD-dependent oxidoreductase [Thermoanaerobaculia bacterium]